MRPSDRTASCGAFATLAVCVLASAAPGQRSETAPFGPTWIPDLAPPGFPSDLVKIPAGVIRLGITAREALAIANEFDRGREAIRDSQLKRLVRELGDAQIRLEPFLIGRHEVTNEQYEAFIRAHPRSRFPFDWWTEADQKVHRERFRRRHGSARPFKPYDYWLENFAVLDWKIPEGRARHPVSYVSGRDANAYAAWIGARLPYEAEWRFGLTGPVSRPARYLWGSRWDRERCHDVLRWPQGRSGGKREVGTATAGRSFFGVDDMLGNVWELTASPFLALDGFEKAFRALARARRRDRQPVWPPWRADWQITCGGSFTSGSRAGVIFRSNTRCPLSDTQRVADVGFRIAKSMQPGLDATTLWYRRRLRRDNLGGLALDLPTAADTRHPARKRFAQRGIERWELDGEVVRGYRMVSFAPVRELPFRTVNALVTAAREAREGAAGVLVAGIFASVSFELRQGTGRSTPLPAGIYVVSYRSRGLPGELEAALRAGARELRRHKGHRAPKESGKEPPNWYEVVDRFGVADAETARFPRKRPSHMTVEPGSLRIPVDDDVLLFRNNDGDYVAWANGEAVHLAGRRSAATVRLQDARLDYVGGPWTHRGARRFEFRVRLLLVGEEANRNWITPDSVRDIAKELRTQAPIRARFERYGRRR